ncbi:MAG: hypothetical protein ACYCOU_03545 [Sulfobacillus sp.]
MSEIEKSTRTECSNCPLDLASLEGQLAQILKRAQDLVRRGDFTSIMAHFRIEDSISVPGSEELFVFDEDEDENEDMGQGFRRFVDWLADRLPRQLSFPPGVVELLFVGQSKGLKEVDIADDRPYIEITDARVEGLKNVGPCSFTSGFIDEGPFDWIEVAIDWRTMDNGCGLLAVNCNQNSPRYGNVLYRPLYDEDDCCLIARDLDEFYRKMADLPAFAYSIDFLARDCAERRGGPAFSPNFNAVEHRDVSDSGNLKDGTGEPCA